MKKIFIISTILFLFTFYKSFNDANQLNYIDLAKKHLKELSIINATANVLFAKILALEVGKQFSSNNDLNQDLILYSSKLRQKIDQVSNDFLNDFNL